MMSFFLFNFHETLLGRLCEGLGGEEGHVACIGERRNTSRILVRNPARKRPFGKPRPSCKCDIEVD